MKRSLESLSSEWSSRNPDKLTDYTPGSHHVSLWVCSKGHEWEAPVKSRTAGYGCPYCSGRLSVKGVNDFQTLVPEGARLWHPTKNGSLKPDMFKPHSHRRVWWLCPECGYEWETTIDCRGNKHHCPVCAGKSHGIKSRNLAVDKPALLEEWDFERNHISPYEITKNSQDPVWWICKEGHRWTTSIKSRTRSDRPNRCPYCAGKRAIPGVNDLSTTDPEIAAGWSERNILKPSEVLRTSHKKVYWECPAGHTYPATVANHVLGRGCPFCAGKKKPKAQKGK